MSLNWLVMKGPVATTSAWARWRCMAAKASLIPSGVPTSWWMSVMPICFAAAPVCTANDTLVSDLSQVSEAIRVALGMIS